MTFTALDEANKAFDTLCDKTDTLAIALQRIVQWSEAYPYTVFPEPDFKKAADLLEANSMTIDSISASVARHIIAGVGAIARKALKDVTDEDPGPTP